MSATHLKMISAKANVAAQARGVVTTIATAYFTCEDFASRAGTAKAEEKVVNPPQKPLVRMVRHSGLTDEASP